MKILLTNDDGFHADGIQELYKSLSERHEVFLVAPEKNCSGFSASISYTTQVEIDQVSETEFIVKGTPADCVYFGLFSLMDKDIDIVISGINHGANIGSDVLYSGTVGAAIGGRHCKYPPIAISSVEYRPKSFDFMSKKSIQLLEVIAQYDNQKFKNKVVNINFPDIDENSFKGFRVVPTARRDSPDKPIVLDENSSKITYQYGPSGTPIMEDFLTDAQAVDQGFVALSILDYQLIDKQFNHEAFENLINE